MRLLRQHLKDTVRAIRNGQLRPALWETRQWLKLTRDDVERRK